jgi:hypothetical protein
VGEILVGQARKCGEDSGVAKTLPSRRFQRPYRDAGAEDAGGAAAKAVREFDARLDLRDITGHQRQYPRLVRRRRVQNGILQQ